MRLLGFHTAGLLLFTVEVARGLSPDSFPRAVKGNGFVSLPVSSQRKSRSHASSKRETQHAFEAALENQEFFYVAEVGIGSPAQNVKVLLDTGSTELWVNPDCSKVRIESQYKDCVSFGQYDPSESKTPPIGPFGGEQINYGDASDVTTQTSVQITYYTDDIDLGGAKITNQTFGVVVKSTSIAQGIIGLGPDPRHGFNGNLPYSLVLNTLAEEGVINSRIFSLDLRHSDEDTGAVVYGGLDTSRFEGTLEQLPLERDSRGGYRLATTLKSMGVTIDGSSGRFNVGEDDKIVLLDSGTTVSRMHYSVAAPILDALGAQSDEEGYYRTSCDNKQAPGSVDFGFGDKVIHVPFKDFIIDLSDESGGLGGDSGGVCYLGLVTTTDLQILGDTVLRAGYFVFDWDNENVHIAQAASCEGKGEVVAVGTGSTAVPSVTGACSSASGSDSTSTISGQPLSSARLETRIPTESLIATVYTVTSCPAFDESCQTGVATQTVAPPVTVTVTAGGSGPTSTSGSDGNSAGIKARDVSWMGLGLGGLIGVAFNLL